MKKIKLILALLLVGSSVTLGQTTITKTVQAAQSGNWTMRLQGNAGAIIDFAGQNATAPANAILIGGEFNTTPTTLTTGKASPFQLDSAANLLINLKTAIPAGSNVIGHVIVDTAPTTAVTIADGSNSTFGAKADAKSTATDTTPVSAMSVLKEISAMEQAPASRAVTNAGTFATQSTLQTQTDTVMVGGVNVKEINGVTPLMGAGNTGTGSLRVTLPSDQVAIPVTPSRSDPTVTSGNITAVDAASTAPASLIAGQTLVTGTATANSSVSATLSGTSSYSVQLSGTWVGTVQFEKSMDGGTTWVSLGMTGIGTATTSTSITGTGANSNAVLHGNSANITNVRVRCTAYTSGTCAVKIQPSYGVFTVLAAQSGPPWSVTANAGTNLNTSALALESGHLASIDTSNGDISGNTAVIPDIVTNTSSIPVLQDNLGALADAAIGDSTGSVNSHVRQSAKYADTIGTKTDNKSTATDTTSVSVVSLLKEISAMAQAPPSHAVTNAGTFAVQNTSAATENFLGFIGGKATIVSANFTRPADTTAYASGDLVANNTTAGSVTPLSFTASRINDASGMLRRIKLKKSGTSTTNASFRLHLYQNDPSTSSGIANGDNGAWSTNESNWLGDCDVSSMMAFRDGASGQCSPSVGTEINFLPKSGTQTIYGLIEARAAYTPGNAEVFTVYLEDLQN